ncbi:HFL236Cp [Eremothecium sinecaudum]|uniref:Large ribosomal subunit protein uL4m n=1 Tax=Eremothecium sinecaudum TaxID=45286 RepID=A0A0X8HUE9_9SACH|nr:HFL236Cp [Eremothecium sinecaudum]AMD21620.1 HFL236Cp [Eremothecium sinecaudum]
MQIARALNLASRNLARSSSSKAPAILPNKGTPPRYTLASLRSFPSLEPHTLIPVPTSVFNAPLRRDILWRAVVYENDNKRVGSSNPPTRSTNGYSRRKLAPQKGTGRARVGDGNSPTRHNGAIAHGGRAPNNFKTDLPKKIYHQAFNVALSYQYRKNHIFVIGNRECLTTKNELDLDVLDIPAAKDMEDNTPLFEKFLTEYDLLKKKLLFITNEPREGLFASTERFEDKVNIVQKEFVDVNDILKADRIFIELEALEYLAVVFAPEPPILNQ